MGGDDLGSDDEFLNPSVSDSFETSLTEQRLERANSSSNKRKRSLMSSNEKQDDASSVDDDDDESPPTKTQPSARVLIEAGRNLENESADVQCNFLSTALLHELQLGGHPVDRLFKLTPSHFVTSSESTLERRLRASISLKKLKSWKVVKSPMVLIVCVSARRAVAVLKELASFRARAAKLFAKHMNGNQQRNMLEENAYGLAVGTPHRLLALCNEQQDGAAALNLDSTRLVLFDCATNPKGFTVCTLPDTAGHCMEFISSNVLPQLEKRKDFKIAML